MRPSPPERLERARVQRPPYVSPAGAMAGLFEIRFDRYHTLRIISSGEAGYEDIRPAEFAVWEHVSVSVAGRRYTPTWEMMCFVKDLFWDEEETVIQYHPPRSQYVNNHPGCLHLWKPAHLEIPLPPASAVGVPLVGSAT